MENRDRMRDQGGRQPGTGTEGDENGTDPRRTREQEEKDEAGRKNNPQRPGQAPRTA